MTSEQQIMKQAKSFAALHVVEGSREILEWHFTGVLRDGVVRQLAEALLPLAPGNQNSLAVSLITEEALNIVAAW